MCMVLETSFYLHTRPKLLEIHLKLQYITHEEGDVEMS